MQNTHVFQNKKNIVGIISKFYMEVLMKEIFISFLEVIKGLIKFPIVFVLVVVAFVLNIIQEFFPTKGIIIIAAICAVILLTDKNGKNYIKKIGVFTFFWFASCIVLVDLNSFNWELMIRIITSYEFIFLGCLIPDYFSQIERERDNTIKKMEERNSILENNQSHQSQ